MTRTVRNRKGDHHPAKDGKIWRGCGDRNCAWCAESRQNVKIKSRLTEDGESKQ